MNPRHMGLGMLVAALAWQAALAAEQTPALKIEPELPPDKDLLARIAALPDNTWMKLPRFKVVGELDWLSPRADERARGPFGRSYCAYAVWALSIDAREWKRVSPDGPEGCGYGFQYDPAAREFIAQNWEGQKIVAWGFDTAKDRWVRKPDPQGDLPAAGSQAIRWYDPDRNVHVFYNSSDVYVYRARRAAK